jgi:hypothetical protein
MRAHRKLGLLLALLVACQPFGGPPAVTPSAGPRDGASDAIGAPQASLPSDLPALLTRGQRTAEEWQEAPVLSELQVDVDEAGAWSGVRLVYLAADADRFLQLTEQGGHFSEERPSLATLQLPSMPVEALEQVPAFPDDALPPEELAAAEGAGQCGVEGGATVLYATGAPVAWDGTTWTEPPEWRALVTGADGTAGEDRGATLDIRTGAGDGCLE